MVVEQISRPIAGEYFEKIFNDTGSITWVKFTRDDFTEWVGAFGRGNYGITKILKQGDFCFVCSDGNGYIVNINSGELVFQTTERDSYLSIRSVVVTDEPDYILYTNYYSIFVLKENKLIKEIRPYDVDGIELLYQENGNVKGQLFQLSDREYWSGFTIDLQTFEYNVQPDVIIDYWGTIRDRKIKAEREAKRTLWQKFWGIK